MENQFLCQIRAEEGSDEAEILIYDQIGASWFGDGVTAKQFVKDLAKIDAALLTVRINSGGGDVFDGLAIFNALRRHDAAVVTEIDGLAASIASIIALAGEEVQMADNAFFMIHDPSGMEWGTAEDMRKMADLLDKVGGSLVNVYAEKTGKSADELLDWMHAETWFDADEAKAAGFVDTLVRGKKIEARADLSAFRNTPKALRAALGGPQKLKDSDADGGAADDVTDTSNQPAAKAKGEPMSNVDAAAQPGAEDVTAALAAYHDRQKSIRALAREHDIEASKVDAWLDDDKITVEAVKDQILAEITAKAKVAPPVNSRVGAPRADADPRRGFENHVKFFESVIENRGAASRDAVKDERLRPLAVHDDGDGGSPDLAFLMPRAFNPGTVRAAAGSDEQGAYSDPYGGYSVPESMLPGILSVGFEGDPTMGRTTMVPMATPAVKILARTDKDHTTSVSGGLTVTRRPETVDFTASRAKMERIRLEASSLVGLAFETEELLQDSAISFAAMIDAGFRDQFASHILNEKIRGVGVGEYEGVLSAACKVTVEKETGQAADTINYINVLKLRARTWGYGNAIWLTNHDCLPQLAQMSLTVGTGGAPVFIPGQFGSTPDTLLGRPVFFSEYPNTIGDEGDLICWNPTQYLEGIYQPLRSAESVHVRFVQHERTFKLWLRNAGASWWRSAITPKKGASTLSPIVTLAARA